MEIQNDVKRLGNLVARMGNAYVEVTHRTTTTEEIVVMNLYEMVLYVNVNASHVFDRNFSVTNTSDNCGDFFIFGSNGTLSLLKKDKAKLLCEDAKHEWFTVQDVNLPIYDECGKKICETKKEKFRELPEWLNAGQCLEWRNENYQLGFENTKQYLSCGSTTIWRYGFSKNVALYFTL